MVIITEISLMYLIGKMNNFSNKLIVKTDIILMSVFYYSHLLFNLNPAFCKSKFIKDSGVLPTIMVSAIGTSFFTSISLLLDGIITLIFVIN